MGGVFRGDTGGESSFVPGVSNWSWNWEDGAEEALKESRRRRVVEKELRDWEEEGDISEDGRSDSEEEELKG